MASTDTERDLRRCQREQVADALKDSGALDEIFAPIDASEPLTGHEGPIKRMLKAMLRHGLEAELTAHVTALTKVHHTAGRHRIRGSPQVSKAPCAKRYESA